MKDGSDEVLIGRSIYGLGIIKMQEDGIAMQGKMVPRCESAAKANCRGASKAFCATPAGARRPAAGTMNLASAFLSRLINIKPSTFDSSRSIASNYTTIVRRTHASTEHMTPASAKSTPTRLQTTSP